MHITHLHLSISLAGTFMIMLAQRKCFFAIIKNTLYQVYCYIHTNTQALSFANTRRTKNCPCHIKLADHRRAMRGRPQEVLCSAYFLLYKGIGALCGKSSKTV